ncbi:hypothetical protein PHLCEN_2v1165 [Hermanssonia centrifuga]|uniref:Uncharacterized protein n=1 Tax=Hermanssonia centrifuga TaxID=98765 RepID=A0A2R6S409_9APHY|nr:hypothetical protein PHLCEN_2v1165 [Hermanssonia centrifuga]
MPPSQVPEDFLSAFPPTLPRSFLSEHEQSTISFDFTSEGFSDASSTRSSAASSTLSRYETCSSSSPSPPLSPFQVDSSAQPQLPRLEITTTSSSAHGRASSISSATVCSINTHNATAAIRAAYNVSVRKKKSFHRSSWNPSPTEFSDMTGRPLPLNSSTLGPLSPSTRSTNTSPLSPPSAATTASPLTPTSLPPVPQGSLLGTLCQPVS